MYEVKKMGKHIAELRGSLGITQQELADVLHMKQNTYSQYEIGTLQYPIDVLIEACRRYTRETSRRITFEYTLVKGVNDSTEHALELSSLLKGMLCHVNLIPLNKVEETGLDTSEQKACSEFKNVLEKKGIPATVRRELGDDIDGACGQLRLSAKR